MSTGNSLLAEYIITLLSHPGFVEAFNNLTSYLGTMKISKKDVTFEAQGGAYLKVAYFTPVEEVVLRVNCLVYRAEEAPALLQQAGFSEVYALRWSRKDGERKIWIERVSTTPPFDLKCWSVTYFGVAEGVVPSQDYIDLETALSTAEKFLSGDTEHVPTKAEAKAIRQNKAKVRK